MHKTDTKFYILVGCSLKEVLMDFCGKITSIPPEEKHVEKSVLVVAHGSQTDQKGLSTIIDTFESSLPIIFIDILSFQEKIKHLNKTVIEINPATFKPYKTRS